MKVGLGIDTGGTYTDAVLFDFDEGVVLAKAKSSTTHQDLSQGIIASIDGLPRDSFKDIQLVSVSSTLATNAIVEGHGGRTALLLLGYDRELVGDLGLVEGFPSTQCYFVQGRHSIRGETLEPLDVEALERISEDLKGTVDSVAISEYLGVRNPEYEIQAREIIQRITGLPVVCGHELTGDLNSVKRAATVWLNARLIPLIHDLIGSVKHALKERAIEAPLMIVKGDGSLVSDSVVVICPIETVMSGPAASVVGGCYLSGVSDGLVVDMGGTTTDIAVVKGGIPKVCTSGAFVGRWRTSVRAVDMRTFGLGGDSHIRLNSTGFTIGPERVIPICVAAAHDRNVRDELRRIKESKESSSLIQVTDFFMKTGRIARQSLEAKDRSVLDAFDRKVLSVFQLAERCGVSHPYLLRIDTLEELQVIERVGLTPTDVLHATGAYQRWDDVSSVLACEIMAEQLNMSLSEFLERVLEKIQREICSELFDRCISDEYGMSANDSTIFSVFMDKVFQKGTSNGPLRVSAKLDSPIVAVGAPVRGYFPQLEGVFNTQVIIPEHSEVANAVGAVTGSVVATTKALIRPSTTVQGIDGYIVHLLDERKVFETVEDALDYAKSRAEMIVTEKANEQGAPRPDVSIQVSQKTATVAEGWGEGFLLEMVVLGTAIGRPKFSGGEG